MKIKIIDGARHLSGNKRHVASSSTLRVMARPHIVKFGDGTWRIYWNSGRVEKLPSLEHCIRQITNAYGMLTNRRKESLRAKI